MEKDAQSPFRGSGINLPDPYLERCKTKKRHYSRDSFLEGEPSKRCAMDSRFSGEGMQAGSMKHTLCDPFEDYVNRADNYPSSNVTTTYRKKAARAVSGNITSN